MSFPLSRCFLSLTLLIACALLSVVKALPLSAHSHPAVRREVRAVWLTTLQGLDWPSRPAATDDAARRQRDELCRQLDKLQAAGINVVLFQTRLRATVAYPSAFEPFDGVFSGVPGRSPLYDPLQFAVEECHRRGMELHAWIVAFPIGKVQAMNRLGRQALTRTHPELCKRAGEEWYMNPALPATADYLAALCTEIVSRYEVDGIHLDYIRYPEKGIPYDDAADYRRLAPKGQSKADWRTANVDRCVQTVSETVKRLKPWVKMSCSPVGKYADLPRASSFGWNARDAVHQDAQRWLREGWMDWLFPMMYFDGRHFYPFIADWKEHEATGAVIPGLGIYLLLPSQKDWPLLAIRRQMAVSRFVGLGGHAFFRARFLLDDVKGLASWLRHDFYAQPALVPPIVPPAAVVEAHPELAAAPDAPELQVERRAHSLHFRWQPVASPYPLTYNIYRCEAQRPPVLVAKGCTATEFALTPALPSLLHARYVVTAVDAFGRESRWP